MSEPVDAPAAGAGRDGRAVSIRRALGESPGLLPGLALVAVLALWAYRDGGFAIVDWAPGALFVLALGLVVLVASPALARPGLPVALAFGFLAAFTAWSFLSIAWAEVQSDALTGANRTLLYLLVFGLVVLTPWRAGAAAVVLGSYAVAIAAVALVSFWHVVEAGDATSFREGRLADPISYANATCALYVMAALAGVYLASRREVPPPLRGLLLAATGVLAELALLTQSRGSLVAVPVTLGILLILAPGRLRLAITVGCVALVVGVAAPTLLDVYDVIVGGGDVAAALGRAREVVVGTGLALAIGGTLLAWIDSRVRPPRRLTEAASRAALVCLLLAVVGASAAVLARDPVERVRTAWEHFRNEDYVSAPGTPHLTSGFGSSRYEVWRVAAAQIRAHPVIGVGADNYAVEYLRERDDQAQPSYPHSVLLRTLAQTGIVGSCLLLGFLIAAAIAIWQRIRRGSPFAGGVAAASASLFVYWFVHGSIDWFWEIPALAAAAFAFLGIASRTGETQNPAPDQGGRWVRRLVVVSAAAASLAAAGAIGPPWLAAREIDAAASSWASDPEGAYERLERARSLDPLTDEADVVEAVIASRLGDGARQERALRRALRRNPVNWYPMVELAALESRRAAWPKARVWIARAAALNPRETTIGFVRDSVRAQKPVSSATLHDMYVDQVTLITGAKQAE